MPPVAVHQVVPSYDDDDDDDADDDDSRGITNVTFKSSHSREELHSQNVTVRPCVSKSLTDWTDAYHQQILGAFALFGRQ